MISMRQTHKANTDTFALNDNKIYIVAGDDKPIKCVDRGEGILIQREAIENADLTQELTTVAIMAA